MVGLGVSLKKNLIVLMSLFLYIFDFFGGVGNKKWFLKEMHYKK